MNQELPNILEIFCVIHNIDTSKLILDNQDNLYIYDDDMTVYNTKKVAEINIIKALLYIKEIRGSLTLYYVHPDNLMNLRCVRDNFNFVYRENIESLKGLGNLEYVKTLYFSLALDYINFSENTDGVDKFDEIGLSEILYSFSPFFKFEYIRISNRGGLTIIDYNDYLQHIKSYRIKYISDVLLEI